MKSDFFLSFWILNEVNERREIPIQENFIESALALGKSNPFLSYGVDWMQFQPIDEAERILCNMKSFSNC